MLWLPETLWSLLLGLVHSKLLSWLRKLLLLPLSRVGQNINRIKSKWKNVFYKFVPHVLLIHDFYFFLNIQGITITPFLHKIFRKCKVFWQFRTHCRCTFASKISDQLKSRSKNWNTDIWGWFSSTSCPKLVVYIYILYIVNIKRFCWTSGQKLVWWMYNEPEWKYDFIDNLHLL